MALLWIKIFVVVFSSAIEQVRLANARSLPKYAEETRMELIANPNPDHDDTFSIAREVPKVGGVETHAYGFFAPEASPHQNRPHALLKSPPDHRRQHDHERREELSRSEIGGRESAAGSWSHSRSGRRRRRSDSDSGLEIAFKIRRPRSTFAREKKSLLQSMGQSAGRPPKHSVGGAGIRRKMSRNSGGPSNHWSGGRFGGWASGNSDKKLKGKSDSKSNKKFDKKSNKDENDSPDIKTDKKSNEHPD